MPKSIPKHTVSQSIPTPPPPPQKKTKKKHTMTQIKLFYSESEPLVY